MFSAITTGTLQAEDALGDEAVAGADPLAGREHEQDGVDVIERLVDRALHPLGEQVESVSSKPGRSTRTSW